MSARAGETTALADLGMQLESLRSAIREQREEIARAKRLAAEDRDLHRAREASLRDEIAAVRARTEAHRTQSPRLAHFAPFRQAFTLYDLCATLGDRIRADAYIAHDDVPLLTAQMLAQRLGGVAVYDAAEFPDRRKRYSQFQRVWPAPALDLMAIYLRPIIRSCGFAITVGEPVVEHIQSTFGIPAHTVFNAREEVVERPDDSIRLRCGVGPEDVLLLHVNTVARSSLFENLVDGLASLGERHHLAVLGRIASIDPGLQDELEHRAHQRGVAHRVHFLGVVGFDEVPVVASGADCAVVAFDPRLGNTMVHNRYFDALAAGLPILSSFNVGARRMFGDAAFYREFDLLDPAGFAAAVKAWELDAVDREQVRAFARERSWALEARKLVGLFEFASSVTILTLADGAEHARIRRFAAALGEAGIRVNIVCRRGSATDPELENVEWFRSERFF